LAIGWADEMLPELWLEANDVALAKGAKRRMHLLGAQRVTCR